MKYFLLDSWKNKKVFESQLNLNKIELNSFPEHWNQFIKILNDLGTKKLLDIGCGVGSMSEICRRHLPHIEYTGIDYSEDAITLAEREWRDHKFYVKNYSELTKEYTQNFDTLHAGALLDVLPDADNVLDFLLSLQSKNVFIGRARITEEQSYYTTYNAYNTITTYSYNHNKKVILDLAQKHNYECEILGDVNKCNLIFQKPQ
jgi:2-polyprenyl-3-methyl-5-hydroxy-6-metoxy-1,4-benzoquinol methylase